MPLAPPSILLKDFDAKSRVIEYISNVEGILRHSPMNNYFNHNYRKTGIVLLVLDFYDIKEWFIHQQHHKPHIEISKDLQQITQKLNHAYSIRQLRHIFLFGRHAIHSFTKYVIRWYLRIEKLPNNYDLKIGIASKNPYKKEYPTFFQYVQFKYEYKGVGKIQNNSCSRHMVKNYKLKQNDLICLELDLTKRQLIFYVNHTDPKLVFNDISVGRDFAYHLCVDLGKPYTSMSIDKILMPPVRYLKANESFNYNNEYHSRDIVISGENKQIDKYNRDDDNLDPEIDGKYLVISKIPAIYRWFLNVRVLPQWSDDPINEIEVGLMMIDECKNDFIFKCLACHDGSQQKSYKYGYGYLKRDDIIEVELNTKTATISWHINGEKVSKGTNIPTGPKIHYRLCVKLRLIGAAIEIDKLYVYS